MFNVVAHKTNPQNPNIFLSNSNNLPKLSITLEIGESDHLPVSELVKMRVLNYWIKKVTESNTCKITHVLYNMILKLLGKILIVSRTNG